jgi:hypothetical protein
MEETLYGNYGNDTRSTSPDPLASGDTARQCSLAIQSSILLVSRNKPLAEPVMDYVVNVADRMKCRVLAIYVNTQPFLADGGKGGNLHNPSIEQNAAMFGEKAAARGVDFDYIQESGKIRKVISRLCHIVKRVEFVFIDQEINIEEAAFGSPVPVFNIVCADAQTGRKSEIRQTKQLYYGEKQMASTSRKGYWLKTLIFGAVTAALYAAVFSNSEIIMHYFTKGGIYALLPVATVFVFSYAHGSFTSNFWSALGIEGSKATITKSAEKSKTVEKRPDARPRVQANA